MEKAAIPGRGDEIVPDFGDDRQQVFLGRPGSPMPPPLPHGGTCYQSSKKKAWRYGLSKLSQGFCYYYFRKQLILYLVSC